MASASSADSMGPARRGDHTTPAGLGIRFSPERAQAQSPPERRCLTLRTKNAIRVPDTRLMASFLPALSTAGRKRRVDARKNPHLPLKKIPVSPVSGRETSRQIKTPPRKGLPTDAGFRARYSQEGFIQSDATASVCHRSISLSARYPTLGPKNGDVKAKPTKTTPRLNVLLL